MVYFQLGWGGKKKVEGVVPVNWSSMVAKFQRESQQSLDWAACQKSWHSVLSAAVMLCIDSNTSSVWSMALSTHAHESIWTLKVDCFMLSNVVISSSPVQPRFLLPGKIGTVLWKRGDFSWSDKPRKPRSYTDKVVGELWWVVTMRCDKTW